MTKMENDFLTVLKKQKMALSIPQVMDELRGMGYDVDGDYLVSSAVNDHVILWSGMSHDFVTALENLRAKRLITYEPMSALESVLTGHMLKLPRATGKYKYSTDHWLPVWVILSKAA